MEKPPSQILAEREQAKVVQQDRKLEQELRASYQQYSKQLADLETMIAANPTSPELTRFFEVERVLKEALTITEESLLNLRKAQLLEHFSALPEGEEIEENPQFPEGKPVQALYTGKSGTMWMDATIINARGKTALVSYDTPLETSMKMCRFVQSRKNHCRYGDQCKFSHGFLLPITSVRERVMEKLVQGGPCLARYEADGLWYEGSIEKYVDEKTISVYYNGYNQTADLEIDDIAPLPALAHKHDKKKGELRLQHVELPVTQIVDPKFGDWQQHTKGFGMKMLEKFGFKPGEGLGKEGQGIAEPVGKDRQVHLPHATSVDNASRDLEKMKAIREKEDRNLKRKLEESESKPEPPETSTFHYLNKLAATTEEDDDDNITATTVPTVTSVKAKPPPVAKLTPADTRKKLRQLTDEVTQLKSELQAVQSGLHRNKNNSGLAATYQAKTRQMQALMDKKQQEIVTLQRTLAPAKKGIF